MSTEGPPNELYQHALARIGSTLRGKWRLDALIGVGGMAAVYAATHRNGHRVAIKMLHPILSMTSSVQERFLREGYAANNVDHPGIAKILDDDMTDEGNAFLVMELLSGETLDARWRRHGGRMPYGEALAVGQALLDVLAAAHDKDILHRDIKPENVFLTASGQLKLLDFGIARVREQAPTAPSVTRTGAMLGTPAFMSPEQARGRVREVDARSDVWAVGATLFAVLTGRYVHQGETPNEILIKTATEEATKLGELMPELPAEAAEIIDRSLAYGADERWPSAAAMRDALRAALRKLDLSIEPPCGEPPTRPVSMPDLNGATVESAPPIPDPPEGTPDPAQISLGHATLVAPPPRSHRLAAAGAVALAIAACFAFLRAGAAPAAAPEQVLAAALPPAPPPAASSVAAPAATPIEALPAASSPPPEAPKKKLAKKPTKK